MSLTICHLIVRERKGVEPVILIISLLIEKEIIFSRKLNVQKRNKKKIQ